MYHKYTDSLAEYTFDEATDEMILSQNSEITDTMDDEKKELIWSGKMPKIDHFQNNGCH